MCSLTFDQKAGFVQKLKDDDVFEAAFIIPPRLSTGDYLTPVQFSDSRERKNFFFLGWYNVDMDTVDFAVVGDKDTKYKMSISDGKSPYEWKIKKKGVIHSSPEDVFTETSFLDSTGQLQPEAMHEEDILSVPYALVKASSGQSVMDAKHDCVYPWSFYGPSMPEFFYLCKVKVITYPATCEAQSEETPKLLDIKNICI